MIGTCDYCQAQRHGRLAGVRHQHDCPAQGRTLLRMTTHDIEMFIHPDLVELDLAMSAWYSI